MRQAVRRTVRGALAFGLLAATASPTAFAEELVVDDVSTGVQLNGTWATSTNGSGFVGIAYRFRVAGDGSSSVRWGFPGAGGGTYDVFARWTSGPNRASNAKYVVAHADGSSTVSVDQRGGGGAW